jgi:hypothetical protein
MTPSSANDIIVLFVASAGTRRSVMSRIGSGDHVAKATPRRTPGVRGIGLVGMGGSDRTSDKRSLALASKMGRGGWPIKRVSWEGEEDTITGVDFRSMKTSSSSGISTSGLKAFLPVYRN